MDRRTFIKTAGMGGIAFLAGCDAHPERHLYTFVQAPEDLVTGQSQWYASTCRECPAGCGLLAKNREGRVVKLEGNPLHPVNRGKLCARGQAALQSLYHPDRLTSPMLKTRGQWQPIALDAALAAVRQKMEAAANKGPDRIAMVTQVGGQALQELSAGLLERYNARGALIFEPLAYESLKFAHFQVFGQALLPGYHLEQADMILGFGADFLETWLSPVQYSRRFKAMHALQGQRKGRYIHVASYQSLTAANADQWLACRPGSEAAVAMGILHLLFKAGRGQHLPSATHGALVRLAEAYNPDRVARQTDLAAETMLNIADDLLAARHPLVLPTGATGSGEDFLAADMATVWLNVVLDPELAGYDFNARHRVEMAHNRTAINAFWQQMAADPVDLLLLTDVNPLYAMPLDVPVVRALEQQSLFKVAFSGFMSETAAAADLIIPVQHSLVSWGSYESLQGMTSMLQPTMAPISPAPDLGDVLIQLWPAGSRPADGFQAYLHQHLQRQKVVGNESDWLTVIKEGRRFRDGSIPVEPPDARRQGVDALARALDRLSHVQNDTLTLQVVPSLRYFDGRSADHPWLAEIPDPVTQVAWQAPALVHPDLMTDRGWVEGEVIEIATAHGSLRTPVYGHPGLHPTVVVIPMGQGHSHMGRYARRQGLNPLDLLSGAIDPDSSAPVFAAAVTRMVTMGRNRPLAATSGSRTQHERKIALSVPLSDAGKSTDGRPGLTMADFPFTAPLPEGYDPHRDIYPTHTHDGYRWGMAVDLDRCIGCSACVAACYAENNVGIVGEEQIIKGREMAWLRIERYQDPRDPARLIFLPMMCQHCDNAPCESVCPVYAPHHSKEGLNNQIYNRCIGTRFCAQNCPYKVRRFNWLAWQWPEPLNLQLNPDVTVRSAGVMEKCSFCVQRIKEGHNRAKNDKRAIADGEIVPACAQTCPTDAIVFGDLMNPGSKVRRLMADPRAYQVLGYLNTKPAVIYLKKVIQKV